MKKHPVSQPWGQQICACVFDAYGTLLDVHSAVGKPCSRLGGYADQVFQLWRTKQLEYTWLRSLMGHYRDFWSVTHSALDFTCVIYGAHLSRSPDCVRSVAMTIAPVGAG